MMEELSISDRLRLLGLAKEIRAVIFMHKQEETNEEKEDVGIEGYVDEIYIGKKRFAGDRAIVVKCLVENVPPQIKALLS